MLHLKFPEGHTHDVDHNNGNVASDWEASLQALLADHRAAVQDVLVKHCELATDTIVQLAVNFQKKASGHNLDAYADMKAPSHVRKPTVSADRPDGGKEVYVLREHMRRMIGNIHTTNEVLKTEVAGTQAEIKKLRTENAGLHPQMLGSPSNEVDSSQVVMASGMQRLEIPVQRADEKVDSSQVVTASSMQSAAAHTASISSSNGLATAQPHSHARSVKPRTSAAVHPAEPAGQGAVETQHCHEVAQPPTNHLKASFYTAEDTVEGSHRLLPPNIEEGTHMRGSVEGSHRLLPPNIEERGHVRERRRRRPGAVFVDLEGVKSRLRQEMAQPEYDVSMLYHEEGFFRNLATSIYFENLTLLVITCNALWIAVDVDLNEAATLPFAKLEFQIADNIFCAFFTFEWFVRFMSFRYKRDTIKDSWFIFDTLLCALMVFETWLVSLAYVLFDSRGSGVLGNASLLKGLRLLRLTRMARILRLLHALPELMVLIKGMFAATRAVFCTIVVLVIIVYVFAILFRQVTDGTPLGDEYFVSVPSTMRLLLLHGTIPDLADLTMDISDASAFYAIIFLFFVLLVSLTVMNMLVGVLVTVVTAVATLEKEGLTMNFVKENLISILRDVRDPSADVDEISKDDFASLLTRDDAVQAFGMMGVDVLGLVDLSDYIFRGHGRLNFAEFMDLVMQLRGSNQATVKDIVDLRKFIVNEVKTQVVSAMSGETGASDEDNLRDKLKILVREAKAKVNDNPPPTFRLRDVVKDVRPGAKNAKATGLLDMVNELTSAAGRTSDAGNGSNSAPRTSSEDAFHQGGHKEEFSTF